MHHAACRLSWKEIEHCGLFRFRVKFLILLVCQSTKCHALPSTVLRSDWYLLITVKLPIMFRVRLGTSQYNQYPLRPLRLVGNMSLILFHTKIEILLTCPITRGKPYFEDFRTTVDSDYYGGIGNGADRMAAATWDGAQIKNVDTTQWHCQWWGQQISRSADKFGAPRVRFASQFHWNRLIW